MTDRTRYRPIPPPEVEVNVHGPGSWTVQLGWDADGNGTRWVAGVIYDSDCDRRHPDVDTDVDLSANDPKLVTWNDAGDVIDGCPEFALDTIPDVSDLLQVLAWDNPPRFTTGVTFDGRPVFIDHHSRLINFVVVQRDADHDEIRVKLDPNDGAMDTTGSEHFDLRDPEQLERIATVVCRQIKFAELCDAYEVPAMDRPDVTAHDRYALIERDTSGNGSRWASLHTTPAAAADSHDRDGTEDPSEIVVLVDLDTNESMIPVGTTITWGPT